MKLVIQRWLGFLIMAIALTAVADDRDKRFEHDFGADRFAADGSLRIDAPVAGDLIAAGGNLDEAASALG